MNPKILQGVLILLLSILAIVFLFMGSMEIAVLFMTLLFVLTNTFRYKQMKELGMAREARWTKGMAILFAVLFVVVLIVIFI
ncbi:hypothetical protein KQ939_10235 [Planococcus sp. CP5-4]|uniref:hypothetical protein n=1 Tax=unclassified Planococcus (in: firmicutes) TaxID=2662419 RepID=UPI001C231E8A|nr:MULTISPECIES: hypothetical protein [unclassified Planococcus (in: firmicutes)]MBU9672306.1 hypothetical protein [Planococcus sp. CP5-4_YE]MBV0909357.1 hypothetical protein [Planococcus sp. CP5-4_UN]MBW6064086.1 hypothetical protein [Planococcus sp. CP5-4]